MQTYLTTAQVNEHGLTDDRDLSKYGHKVEGREPYTGPVFGQQTSAAQPAPAPVAATPSTVGQVWYCIRLTYLNCVSIIDCDKSNQITYYYDRDRQ